MKIYIAGKIGDLPEEEYKSNFEKAKQHLIEQGYEVLSPVDLPHNHDKSWSSYMKEDLRALMECEALFALRNWKKSPGATIEVNLAVQLGINIIFQK